jgi:hypothetical protein
MNICYFKSLLSLHSLWRQTRFWYELYTTQCCTFSLCKKVSCCSERSGTMKDIRAFWSSWVIIVFRKWAVLNAASREFWCEPDSKLDRCWQILYNAPDVAYWNYLNGFDGETYLHTRTYIRARTHTLHTYAHIYIHIRTHTYIHTHTLHIYIHTYTYIHTHTYTYIHTHIYI